MMMLVFTDSVLLRVPLQIMGPNARSDFEQTLNICLVL